MMINVAKLHGELVAAGVPITGCASDGRIDYLPTATDADKATAAQVLAAHDPTPTPDQVIGLRPIPPRAIAALLVRASSSFASLTAAQKAKVQTVIDNAAASILDLLS